jgi:hypothetical protein
VNPPGLLTATYFVIGKPPVLVGEKTGISTVLGVRVDRYGLHNIGALNGVGFKIIAI